MVKPSLARPPEFSKESIVMIGDREHDMYGDEEELREAGATWIVKDARGLGELLLENEIR